MAATAIKMRLISVIIALSAVQSSGSPLNKVINKFSNNHNMVSEFRLDILENFKHLKTRNQLEMDSLDIKLRDIDIHLKKLEKEKWDRLLLKQQEIAAFQNSLDAKVAIITELKKKMATLKRRTISLPGDESRLRDYEQDIRLYEEGLAQMLNKSQWDVNELKKLVGQQEDPLKELEFMDDCEKVWDSLTDDGRESSVVRLLERQFQDEFQLLEQIIADNSILRAGVNKQKTALERSHLLTLEYEEGDKAIDYSELKAQVLALLDSFFTEPEDSRFCSELMENHLVTKPKTAIFHCFYQHHYLFSLKFKPGAVTLKYYKGQKPNLKTASKG